MLTSSFPSPSKCTKIVDGWGFAPDTTVRLPSWIKGSTSKGAEKEGGKEANRRKEEVTGG